MASGFFLDGTMISRSVRRSLKERSEEREEFVSATCVLDYRGRRHVVRLINLSRSGAMLLFAQVPNIGEKVSIHLLDRGRVSAQVRWVRDGRIGLLFEASAG